MVVSIEDIPQTKIIPAGRKASGGSGSRVEAAIGIEPMYRGFADLCLTAWLRRRPENPECGTVRTWSGPAPGGGRPTDWSGKRDSNPRLQPWQGCTLPLSYSRQIAPKPERPREYTGRIARLSRSRQPEPQAQRPQSQAPQGDGHRTRRPRAPRGRGAVRGHWGCLSEKASLRLEGV